MYWIRFVDIYHPLGLILVSLTWSTGGLLMARHAFELEGRERLLAGVGIGMAVYVALVNLIGHVLGAEASFWLAGVLVLLIGGGAGLHSRKRLLCSDDCSGWHSLVWVGALAILLTLTARGLGIFDDRKNLSIVSLMAAGDIPPHFYMNGVAYFRYHYGSQLFAASLMRLGGMFPWSALDLAKGLLSAVGVGLAYGVGRRLTHSSLGGLALAGVALFASGSRYLLLFLPQGWLSEISRSLEMHGSAVDSAENLLAGLRGPWIVEGGPPMPIPLAYVNGILQPLILALHSSAIGLSRAMLFLFLLIAGRMRGWPGVLVLTLVLSSWALAWETDFLLVGMGVAGALAFAWLGKRDATVKRRALAVGVAFLLAGLLALVQGGTLTEVLRLTVVSEGGTTPASGFPFGLRLPPAVVSAHLGELELGYLLLSDRLLLLLALAELGLALLAAPLVTWWFSRWLARGRIAEAAVSLGALPAFLLPFLFRYESDRDITRLTAFALFVWAVLGAGALWIMVRKWKTPAFKAASVGWGVALIFPGVVALGALLSSLARPMIAEDFGSPDAKMSQAYWDTIEPDGWVLDSHLWRAVVVLGRLTHSTGVDKQPLQTWSDLVSAPDPAGVAAAGYAYVYMDEAWWDRLTQSEQRAYQSGCARLIGAIDDSGRNGDRWLWDVRGCNQVTPGEPG